VLRIGLLQSSLYTQLAVYRLCTLMHMVSIYILLKTVLALVLGI